MAHSKLPLRIKVDVRDRFEAANTPVQKALSTLESVVGLKTSCNVEWDLLYSALDENFPDKTTFVSTISAIIVTWCDVLSTRLENDRFSTWTNLILGKLEVIRMIKLHVQVSDDNRPTTAWSAAGDTILLSIPRATSLTLGNVSSGFESDFARFDGNALTLDPTNVITSQSREEEWAEIDASGDAESVNIGLTNLSTDAASEKMPLVAMLPTPDILLRSLTPYILHVTQKGSGKFVEYGSTRSIDQGSGRLVGQTSSTQVEQGGGKLVVQGTHGPSLQFLHQYLQRWVKKDHQDSRKVPLLRITLQESHFGLGINHDTLVVEPYDTAQEKRGVAMNPTVLLFLIENVLGYRCLPSISPGSWEFKRDVAFK